MCRIIVTKSQNRALRYSVGVQPRISTPALFEINWVSQLARHYTCIKKPRNIIIMMNAITCKGVKVHGKQ